MLDIEISRLCKLAIDNIYALLNIWSECITWDNYGLLQMNFCVANATKFLYLEVLVEVLSTIWGPQGRTSQ